MENFKENPVDTIAKSSKNKEYQDMFPALLGNPTIPPDVWDNMPEKLREILATAQKNGAKIGYKPNCRGFLGNKTYDAVKITLMNEIFGYSQERYNVKNGIMTYSGFYAGVLCAGGTSYDPETGTLSSMFRS